MSKLSVSARHQSSERGAYPTATPQSRTATIIPEEQRRHMIAEAAYYLAEHRGFQGGDPGQDWLQAEMEIDHQLQETLH